MRNRVIVFLYLFSVFISVNAQNKFTTKSGELNFKASVPSFVEVIAKNRNVSAILLDNGDFAILALVNGFRFKVALMEEHFNENYVESVKYPKTTFSGKILDFNVSDLTEKEITYTISGVITLHGVDRYLEVPVSIIQKNNSIVLTSNFVLKPEYFNIKIPKIVNNKIAEEINVSVSFNLTKLNSLDYE